MKNRDLKILSASEYPKIEEDTLRTKEDFWYTLAENHPEAILISVAGEIIFANRAAARSLGYSSPELLVGRSFFDHMSLEERVALPKQLSLLSGNRSVFLPDLKLTRVDGTEAFVELTAESTFFEGRTVELMFLKDVSCQKQLEIELNEREGSYRLLAENASDVIMRHKLDGTCVYISPTCRRQSGFEPEEFIGKSALDYVHPEDLERVVAALSDVLQKKDVVSAFRIRHKQGGYLWVEATGRTVLDQVTGEPTEIITVTRDISKRMQAIEQLRISEELTSGILAASLDGIIALEAIRSPQGGIEDFRFLLVNPMAQRMLHRPDVSMEGKSLLQDLPIFRDVGLYDRYVQVVETGEPYHGEIQFTEDFTAWFHITVVRRGDGLAITLRDISDRKRSEEALRESEERLRFILDAANMGTWEWDAGKNELLASETTKKLFGLTDEESVITNQDYLDRIHVEDREQVLEIASRAIGGQQNLEAEYRVNHPDHGVRWLYGQGQVQRSLTGEVVRVLGVATDVTERKQAHESLRSSELKYRALMEQAGDAIFLADADTGMLLDANCRAQELIGFSLEEIRKMHQTDLHPKNEMDRYRDQFLSHKEENPTLVPDNIVVHQDGELIPVDISASVIDIEGKRLVLGIFRDITERHRAEAQIRRTLQRERELGELKSRFISMASHELRTPLATILSSTFLLEQFAERWKRDMVEKYLQRIRSNVNQMIELLEDVLVVGRAEEGLLSFHPARIDVLEFIQNLVDEFRTGIAARHVLIVNARAKSYFAEIDEKLLRMIVANLLSNACKYSEADSKITIGVSRKDLNVVITIRDEGIGIRSEDVPFVFEPFHRGSNVGSVRGTGLGLTLVARATELHSGHVLIDSKEGKGTVISIQLPLVQS